MGSHEMICTQNNRVIHAQKPEPRDDECQCALDTHRKVCVVRSVIGVDLNTDTHRVLSESGKSSAKLVCVRLQLLVFWLRSKAMQSILRLRCGSRRGRIAWSKRGLPRRSLKYLRGVEVLKFDRAVSGADRRRNCNHLRKIHSFSPRIENPYRESTMTNSPYSAIY